jgi:hypothetical protein
MRGTRVEWKKGWIVGWYYRVEIRHREKCRLPGLYCKAESRQELTIDAE